MPPYVVLRRDYSTDDLVPTTDQRNTIIVACVYALAILLLVGPCAQPLLTPVEYPNSQGDSVPI